MRRARRAARDGDRARRGRQRHPLLVGAVLPRATRPTPSPAPPAWTAICARSSTTCKKWTTAGARDPSRCGADSQPRAAAHGERVPLDGPLPREDAEPGAPSRKAGRRAEAGVSARSRGRSRRRRHDARDVARDEFRPSRGVFPRGAGARGRSAPLPIAEVPAAEVPAAEVPAAEAPAAEVPAAEVRGRRGAAVPAAEAAVPADEAPEPQPEAQPPQPQPPQPRLQAPEKAPTAEPSDSSEPHEASEREERKRASR